MAGRSAPSGAAAFFRTDIRPRLWNLYHARIQLERSRADRRSRSSPCEGHSNNGSFGMERPPRIPVERHDRRRGAIRNGEIIILTTALNWSKSYRLVIKTSAARRVYVEDEL